MSSDEIRHLYDRIKEQLVLIKKLEERIVSLERVIENNKSMRLIQGLDDSYYWEHG